MTEWLMFAGALAVAYLVPGPDMLLVLRTGAVEGRRGALAVAGGLALARACHVGAAALGLATLLRASPALYEILRLGGAAYLIWLGVALARSEDETTAATTGERTRSLRIAATRGFLTNLTNPKALLFCSVLLPQFVSTDDPAPGTRFLALGVALAGIGLAFDLLYATVGTLLGRPLANRPGAAWARRWGFAVVLIGLGLRLAVAPVA